jgi:hypothetical protein
MNRWYFWVLGPIMVVSRTGTIVDVLLGGGDEAGEKETP